MKGHGVAYMQGTVASHYLPMSDAEYAQALNELTIAHAAAVAGPAMRDEFARAMIALSRERNDLVFITGDVGYMAVEEIAEAYGERFINAGIAEQNMISLAAGLAREGHLPWVYSIATFLAFRPYEQIRTDVCLHKRAVKLVGNGGGYGYGIMGPPSRARGRRRHARAAQHARLPTADGGRRARGRERDGPRSAARTTCGSTPRPESPERSHRLRRGGNQAGAKGVLVGMGPVLGNLYELGDEGLLDDFEIWNVGVLPLDEIPPTSSRASREKQRLVIIEEHYRACGLAEALSYRLVKGCFPARLHQPACTRVPDRTLRQPAVAPGRERAGRARLRLQLRKVVRG